MALALLTQKKCNLDLSKLVVNDCGLVVEDCMKTRTAQSTVFQRGATSILGRLKHSIQSIKQLQLWNMATSRAVPADVFFVACIINRGSYEFSKGHSWFNSSRRTALLLLSYFVKCRLNDWHSPNANSLNFSHHPYLQETLGRDLASVYPAWGIVKIVVLPYLENNKFLTPSLHCCKY